MGAATEPTRVRLLEEAIRVIESGGESALSVRAVAGACGVTTPMIYKAYGSREGLIVAAQAERFRRAIEGIAAPFSALVESATTVDELRSVIVALSAATQHPDRVAFRRVQYEVLGATIGRPDLRVSVDIALRSLIDRSSRALAVARDRGLVRADVALPELLWWYFGQVQGRLLVEQTDAAIDGDAWNATSLRAVLAVLFGD
jgi:AcrR family transcriptional regulator